MNCREWESNYDRLSKSMTSRHSQYNICTNLLLFVTDIHLFDLLINFYKGSHHFLTQLILNELNWMILVINCLLLSRKCFKVSQTTIYLRLLSTFRPFSNSTLPRFYLNVCLSKFLYFPLIVTPSLKKKKHKSSANTIS